MNFILHLLKNAAYLAAVSYISSAILVLEPRKMGKRQKVICWLLAGSFLLLLSCQTNSKAGDIVFLILTVIGMFAFLHIFYRKSTLPVVYNVIFILAYIGLLDCINDTVVQAVLRIIGDSGKVLIFTSAYDSVTQLVLSLITLASLVSFSKYIWQRYPKNIRRMNRRQISLMIAVIVSDLLLFFLLWSMETDYWGWNRAQTLLLCMLNLVCSLIIVIQLGVVLPAIASENLTREKAELTEQYLEMQKNHYLYLENRERETRKFRHDLSEHLNMLAHLFEIKDYEKAESYLEQMHGKIDSFGTRVHLNNGIAEAIVIRFMDEAARKNITFKVRGSFPSNCGISMFDLCTILSNLLSNAMEAVELCAGKRINLEIRHDENAIFIFLSNDCLPELKVNGGSISTHKLDKNSHGFGLENVKDAIERNGGWINMEASAGVFSTYIEMKNRPADAEYKKNTRQEVNGQEISGKGAENENSNCR